jgi:hypothetical protein
MLNKYLNLFSFRTIFLILKINRRKNGGFSLIICFKILVSYIQEPGSGSRSRSCNFFLPEAGAAKKCCIRTCSERCERFLLMPNLNVFWLGTTCLCRYVSTLGKTNCKIRNNFILHDMVRN